jgi:hypothetical protein
MDPTAIPRIAAPAMAAVFMFAGLRSPRSDQAIPLTLILQVAKASVDSDHNRPLNMNPIEGKYTCLTRNMSGK